MTNFSIFLKSFLFTSLLVLILSHQALAAKKQRNWRIGLGRMINTVYYGYETKKGDSDKTKVSANSSGQLYSTSLVLEYLLFLELNLILEQVLVKEISPLKIVIRRLGTFYKKLIRIIFMEVTYIFLTEVKKALTGQ